MAAALPAQAGFRVTKTFYITTAIHYVNDFPHIGHMYENVVADVIARHRRRMGDDVWFLTGTDEHGQKIERSAAKEGITPIELADRVVAHHRDLWAKLNISYDDFIRTTEPRHRVGVYELIRRIQERSPEDIYLGEHSGWYCNSEETFIPDSQVADGRDPDGHPVEKTTERNYFFKLSRYGPLLLDFYRRNPDFVRPATRFNEVISFVQSGLKDLSVSRTAISWGIPFPGNPDHVVYVWMDALTNYISALGFGSGDDRKLQRYWPADVHLIGKDIVRFHAVYWPAFLMAAGIEPPRSILGHGFWLRDDLKISKSLGNVVRPSNIIEQFGTDPFRYFMLRDMVFGQDSNYSDEAFVARYNADLANDLGNTLSRAIKVSAQRFHGKTPPVRCDSNDVKNAAEAAVPLYVREMDAFAFQRALDAVWTLLNAINGYLVAKEPWSFVEPIRPAGIDKDEHIRRNLDAYAPVSRVIWNALEGLRIVWVMMAPFMPTAAAEALSRLGADPTAIDAAALEWGALPTHAPVRVSDPLFPRIDAAQYLAGTPAAKETKMQENKPSTPAASAGNASPARVQEAQAVPPDAARISIDQFFEIDLRVAEVKAAERVPKSKKLMKLHLSTGDAERTVVAGIAGKYTPEELVGRKVVIVANLQPAMLMGVESNGMILAASIDGEPSLLSVDPGVPAGTKVR
jgi:methionyl-tRNA synthetase